MVFGKKLSKREREVFFVKSEVMMNRPLIGDLLPVLKNILLQISSQNAHKEWSCTFELSCNKKNGRREVGLLRGGRRPVASCSQGGRWAGRGQAAPRPQVKQPGATFLQLSIFFPVCSRMAALRTPSSLRLSLLLLGLKFQS